MHIQGHEPQPPVSNQNVPHPFTETTRTPLSQAQLELIGQAANLLASNHVSELKGTVATHHLPSADQAKLSQPKESSLMNMIRSALNSVRDFFKSAFQTSSDRLKGASKFNLKEGMVDDKSAKPIDPRSQKIKSLMGEIREQERLKAKANPQFVDLTIMDKKIDQYKKQIKDLEQEIEDDALDKAMEEIVELGGGELEASVEIESEELNSVPTPSPSAQSDPIISRFFQRNENLEKLKNEKTTIEELARRTPGAGKDSLKDVEQRIRVEEKSMSPQEIKLAELKIHKENRERLKNDPFYNPHGILDKEITILDQAIEKLEQKFNKKDITKTKINKTQSESLDPYEEINKKIDKIKSEIAHLKDERKSLKKEIDKKDTEYAKLAVLSRMNDIEGEILKLEADERALKQERDQMEIDEYRKP